MSVLPLKPVLCCSFLSLRFSQATAWWHYIFSSSFFPPSIPMVSLAERNGDETVLNNVICRCVSPSKLRCGVCTGIHWRWMHTDARQVFLCTHLYNPHNNSSLMCKLLKCGHSSTPRLREALALNTDRLPAGCLCHTVAVVQKSPSWLANQRHLPPSIILQIHFIWKLSPLLTETPEGKGVTQKNVWTGVWLISLLWGLKQCVSLFFFFSFLYLFSIHVQCLGNC